MPFADEGRLVACPLKLFWKGRGLGTQGRAVVQDAMLVCPLPAQNRRTARRTQRGRDKGVLEKYAVLHERVEMRRLEKRHDPAYRVVALVVNEDKNNVALSLLYYKNVAKI